MFLFEVGGGKFGDVNSLLQLFIRSKLEDISILVLLCLNTYTTKSCECRAGRVFQDQLVSTRSVPHKSAISLLCARGRMGHAIILAYFKHAEIYA